MQKSEFQRNYLSKIGFPMIVVLMLLFQACSVPMLEDAQCTEARVFVKKFYSLHFDGEMKFSPQSLKKKESFLSDNLKKTLENVTGENDVFTVNSTDFPKAFRLGKCQTNGTDKTVFEVVLFWKTDDRSEEKTIKVESIKKENNWLIDKIIQ